MPTTINFMINVEPHYHRTTFSASYEDITAKDVLNVASKACRDFYRLQTSGLPPPEELTQQEAYGLHYITEQAAAFNLAQAREAGYDIRPVQRSNPDVLKQALGWYRETGHYLASEYVDSVSKLAGTAPETDETVVRWYVVVAAVVMPIERHPLILKEGCLVRRRNAYLDAMIESLGESRNFKEICGPALFPSSSGSTTPSQYDLAQVRSKAPISIGLPDFGPHPTAYERAFAYAYNAFFNREQVVIETAPTGRHDSNEFSSPEPFDMYIFFHNFVKTWWHEVYETEKERSTAIFEMLGQLFDDPNVDADDRVGECTTAHGLPALYVCGEDDVIPCNVRGYSPVDRAMLGYQRRIGSDRYKAVREMTCCPCLVIVREWDKLAVSMAYLTDKVYGTELCRFALRTNHGRTSGPFVDLQILRNTALMLRDSYAKVHTGCTLPHTPHLFPRLASVIDLFPSSTSSSIAALKSLNLTIMDRVPVTMNPVPIFSSVNRRCMHFRGAVQHKDDGTYSPVYVKIVDPGYGEEAHRLLASHSPPLAPQLLYCDKILPHLLLVVMEDLQGATLDTLSTPMDMDMDTSDILGAIDRDIVSAVSLLHAKNLVHGDVRASHVVIQHSTAREEEDGVTRAYLLKFDWALEEGQALYSLWMHDDDSEWPKPVESLRARVIKKVHDETMLARLRKQFVPKTELVRDCLHSDEDTSSEGEDANRPSKKPRLSPIDTDGLMGLSSMQELDKDEVPV